MDESLTCSLGVSLRDLLPGARFFGARDIQVTSCSSDSRCVRPGDLFVALCGAERDGHEFAREAVAGGATAVLAERPLPLPGVAQCLVPDSRRAFGELCQALAGDPSRHLKVVGVTGTHGKTTTAGLIAAVLEEAGYRTGLIGSLGYSDGLQSLSASHTPPPPPSLAQWLGRMAGAGCSHTALEVSSRALSLSRLSGVELDTACITHVGQDHFDHYTSLARYQETKARLLEYLSPTGCAILNADDPVCAKWLSAIDAPVLTVGITTPAELTARVVERLPGEQTFLLSAGCESIPVRTRVIGDHYVTSCLMAAAVGLIYGVHLETAVRGLESFVRVPGRMEPVD